MNTEKNKQPAPDATGSSKYLSYVLRHEPQAIGLQLDAEGWADIDALIAGAARHGRQLDRDDRKRVRNQRQAALRAVG